MTLDAPGVNEFYVAAGWVLDVRRGNNLPGSYSEPASSRAPDGSYQLGNTFHFVMARA